MARKVGYLFSTESDLDRSLEATRRVYTLNFSNGQLIQPGPPLIVFAQVDVGGIRAGTNNKRATAKQVIPDEVTGGYINPGDEIRFIFDSDNNTNDRTYGDLYSMEELEEEEVVQVAIYEDDSEAYQSLALKQASPSTALFYIEITASTNISTYTGTIYDNPIDRNSVEAGVTVRALQHSDGTLPNSASGQGFYCVYEKENNVYIIVNYSVAYGS